MSKPALFVLGFLAVCAVTRAEEIVFPADAGIVNVKAYGAKGDGVTDDTAAIQKALSDHPSQHAIIYLPHGAYLIRDTLQWPAGTGAGNAQKRTVLQGQSREGSILKLADRCAGFADPQKPRAMVWTGKAPAQRFGNAIRDLTFDTGTGNPGAIGVQFMANNQGCVRAITIRGGGSAPRAAGTIGLDLGYSNEQGPCLIQDVRVIGFGVGVSCRHGVDSITFERVTLEEQGQVGFRNDGQVVSLRGLKVTGSAPAVVNLGAAVMTLLDAELTRSAGAGGGGAAITNDAVLWARNVKTSGYALAVGSSKPGGKTAAGPAVEEFVSHPVLSLFPSPPKALGLPVKDPPEVPWDKLDDWANGAPAEASSPGAPAGGRDITQSLQAAIDSGKPTVYLPRGKYRISRTIILRGNVRRLIGCEAALEAQIQDPAAYAIRVEDGAAPAVTIERIHGSYARNPMLQVATRRTVIVRSGANLNVHAAGPGELFLEDVCANPTTDHAFTGRTVWARQLNVENDGRHVLNDGGVLWILGLKTERGGTLIETRGGGKTELAGAFCYTTTDPRDRPMFIIDNAAASFILGGSCFKKIPYQVLVRETRGGQTKELTKGDAPSRLNEALLPLFVGYRGE